MSVCGPDPHRGARGRQSSLLGNLRPEAGGDGGFTGLDVLQPDDHDQDNYRIVLSDGPITSRLERALGRMPAGTLIYGRV